MSREAKNIQIWDKLEDLHHLKPEFVHSTIDSDPLVHPLAHS